MALVEKPDEVYQYHDVLHEVENLYVGFLKATGSSYGYDNLLVDIALSNDLDGYNEALNTNPDTVYAAMYETVMEFDERKAIT